MSDADAYRSKTGPLPNSVKGLGGWLILVLIGLCATPLLGLWGFREIGSTLALTNRVGGFQSGLIYGELAAQIVILLLAPLGLLYLYFGRSARFPGLYIWWLVVSILYTFIDLAAVSIAFRDVYEASGTSVWTDPETASTVSRQIIPTAIWIPYMLRSARVKNTFVN
jgi:hypothetical protein